MDDVYEITQFLPINPGNPQATTYIQHHSDSLQKCLDNKLYSSTFVHLHLLYMTFVYYQLLRISEVKQNEFELCWIGFPSQEKEFMKDNHSPFSFSKINEKTVFRFFRLIGFNDGMVARVADCVNSRNGELHADGQVKLSTEAEFNNEAHKYISNMDYIVKSQLQFLVGIYDYAVNSPLYADTGYQITDNDIELGLVMPYHFSKSEIQMLILGRKRTDKFSKYLYDQI